MVVFHLTFLAFAALVILYADKQASAWFFGKKETLSHKTLKIAHYGVWIGLLGLITTGAYMAYPMIGYLSHDPKFIAKMLFVGILVTNAFLIDSLMKVATERPFATLATRERVPLFLSGAISATAWVSAALLGFFLF